MDRTMQALARRAKAGDRDAQNRLAGRLSRIATPDLASFVTEPDGAVWNAGQQLDALTHYTGGRIRILRSEKTRGRRGRIYALLTAEVGEALPLVALWRLPFGDCPSCDSIMGKSGAEVISRSFQGGATRCFWSFDQAREFLCATTEPLWVRNAEPLFALMEGF